MSKLVINVLGEVLVDDELILGHTHSVGGDHMVWFGREADRLMTPKHAATTKLVWAMQDKTESEGDGTVRVAYWNDALRVYSEQLVFSDDTARIEALYAAAAKAKANVTVNYEEPCLDHGWKPDDRGAMIEYYGENHGRLERELDIHIPVFDETEENVLAAIKALTEALAT